MTQGQKRPLASPKYHLNATKRLNTHVSKQTKRHGCLHLLVLLQSDVGVSVLCLHERNDGAGRVYFGIVIHNQYSKN